jgi:hypothetical protein
VALLSEAHHKPHKRFYVRIYQNYRNESHPGAKSECAVAVRKGVRYNYVDLPPLISIEATGFCITLDKKKSCLQWFSDLLLTDHNKQAV